MPPKSSFRFDVLNRMPDWLRLKDRQNREAAERREQEAAAQRLAASERANFDVLRDLETRQREAAAQDQRAAETRGVAKREAAQKEAERVAAAKLQDEVQKRAAASKAEDERTKQAEATRQQKQQELEQVAASSWKIRHEARGPNAALADLRELMDRQERRDDDERRRIEKANPEDAEKLEQHDQFSVQKIDAIRFPDQYLQGKSPDQIRALAQQAQHEARKDAEPQRAATPQRTSTGSVAAYEEGILARNRGVAMSLNRSSPAEQGANDSLRPQQATTDTRGLGRSHSQTDDRSVRQGEITDRKQRQAADDERRPKSDARALIEASRAQSAQRSADRGRGGEDGGRD